MKNKLTFLGHGSLKVVTKDDVVVYIDPAFPRGDYSQAADLILVSHHHGDHDRVDLVTKKDDCIILDSTALLVDDQYQTKRIQKIEIEAVEAYNKNHKKEESVGFVLYLDDVKIYFSGDTSTTQQMASLKDYKLDYVILPIDGYYNMTPQEADACVALMEPRYFIPIHNDPRSMQDGQQYDTGFDLLDSKNIIRMNHGETIELNGGENEN